MIEWAVTSGVIGLADSVRMNRFAGPHVVDRRRHAAVLRQARVLRR